MTDAEYKRDVIRRLQEYRKKHGLGCLAAVAKEMRTRGRINDTTLRMLLTGDTALRKMEDWRKIGNALDRLEDKDAA